jgi:hypothetical protein
VARVFGDFTEGKSVLIDQWTTSVASLNVAVRIAAQHRAGLECFRTCCDRPVDVRLI